MYACPAWRLAGNHGRLPALARCGQRYDELGQPRPWAELADSLAHGREGRSSHSSTGYSVRSQLRATDHRITVVRNCTYLPRRLKQRLALLPRDPGVRGQPMSKLMPCIARLHSCIVPWCTQQSRTRMMADGKACALGQGCGRESRIRPAPKSRR